MRPAVVPRTRPFLEGLRFGECPRWHDGRLWFVDFFSGTVSSAGVRPAAGDGVAQADGAAAGDRPAADVRVELEVPGEPAGLGWLPDGCLLVVARKPRTVLRLEPGGTLVEHGDLRPAAGFHANDMVVDALGRAYVGNFGFDLDRFIEEEGVTALRDPPGPPTTSLVRIDPDGSAHIAAEALSFPNGMVITPDGRTLVVAETLAARLTAFTIDEQGLLGDRREWAALPGRAPDGICLDAEGESGSPTPCGTNACSSRLAARSSTGWRPPSTASPACWVAPTGARSS
ncbi:MAG: SMP-30/gluconolactonase/LRE family protein [Acidimicrobiales bacterium]